MIEEMCNDKIIEAVSDLEHTAFVAPGFFIPKTGTEKLRFVIDYTGLNRFVERPVHPFMSTTEVLNAIPPDSKVFLKADCTSGYYQIPLDKESSLLTTFLIPQGKYCFKRSPMGLSSSSDVFCQRTDEALQNVPGLVKLGDDLLLAAPNLNTLLARAKTLMTRCRENSITLSLRKLDIGDKLPFAGYIIGKEGVQPDPARIKAIMALKPPENISHLRSFLGAVNQLSIFCPDLAHLTNLNRQLLKKNTHFLWTKDHNDTFEKTKTALANKMCLNYFDPTRRTELLTDASRLNGIGYALMQRNDKDEPFLIQCGSRSLTGAESRYATIELEYVGNQKMQTLFVGTTKIRRRN